MANFSGIFSANYQNIDQLKKVRYGLGIQFYQELYKQRLTSLSPAFSIERKLNFTITPSEGQK